MQLILLLLDIVAVYRLTKIIIEDRITDELRDFIWKRFPPHSSKFGYLFTCPWCVSIWAGIIVFGLRRIDPKAANWLSGTLAASEATGRAYEKGI